MLRSDSTQSPSIHRQTGPRSNGSGYGKAKREPTTSAPLFGFVRDLLEAPSGFEPEMEVLQTSALPLGYGAPRVPRGGWPAGADKKCAATTALEEGEKMERETGFEPATSTLARSHSTTELFPLSED
jgi:hypothetical protein